MKRRSLITILTIILFSCIQELNIKSIGYEQLLVVDGLVTDSLQQQYINLSYTSPLDSFQFIPVENATVTVESNEGQTYNYQYLDSGKYVSLNEYKGVPGFSYRLLIENETKSYLSDWMELYQSPNIDSIYDKYKVLPSEELGENVGGIQFFLDGMIEADGARYFRYEWEEVYQLIVPYPSKYEYFPETNTWEYREAQVGICYPQDKSNSIILGNAIGSTQNRIAEIPIRYHSQSSQALRDRYLIKVTQYALSPQSYTYYKNIKKTIESTGTFFDSQLGPINGNVRNINNAEEIVLGLFDVSGVNSKSKYFNLEDLEEPFKRPEFHINCRNTLIRTTRDSVAYYMQPSKNNLIVNEFFIPMEPDMEIAPEKCAECESYAPTQPPENWRDR